MLPGLGGHQSQLGHLEEVQGYTPTLLENNSVACISMQRGQPRLNRNGLGGNVASVASIDAHSLKTKLPGQLSRARSKDALAPLHNNDFVSGGAQRIVENSRIES